MAAIEAALSEVMAAPFAGGIEFSSAASWNGATMTGFNKDSPSYFGRNSWSLHGRYSQIY